jgi:hypothetical protein
LVRAVDLLRDASFFLSRVLKEQHPGEDGVIRQVLQGIFTSDPMMQKAPPPPREAAPPAPLPLLIA